MDYIQTDSQGNIWSIQNGHVYFHKANTVNEKLSYTKQKLQIPFNKAQSVFPYNPQNIFIHYGDRYLILDITNYEDYIEKNPKIAFAESIKGSRTKTLINGDLVRENSTSGDLKIRPNETLKVYLSSALLPNSSMLYAIAHNDDEIIWKKPSENSVMELKHMRPYNNQLGIRNKSFLGTSEPSYTDLEVDREFLSGPSTYLLGGLSIAILMMLSYIIGYNRGMKI